jgi:4-hydroxy-3-methylbut-2-enyl diphosphate reductase
MEVVIDKYSGFCPGVTNAIDIAEKHLEKNGELFCLGDIVHNTVEVNRLKNFNLKIIDYETFRTLKNTKVLIRAHGEPPETYSIAKSNNIELVDATCSVVIKLQNRIKKIAALHSDNAQIVIFGKKNHAEVNGLVGQAGGNALVISNMEDVNAINLNKDIYIFSQTTRSPEKYRMIVGAIEKRSAEANNGKSKVHTTHSICPLVEKREPLLIKFAKKHDVIVFVSDLKSSNGKMLFDLCAAHNSHCYFITSPDDINSRWFNKSQSVGVCGATSTPRWLMEDVKTEILKIGELLS